eukprot:664484-Pelagomonas_calceolata.AAC.1
MKQVRVAIYSGSSCHFAACIIVNAARPVSNEEAVRDAEQRLKQALAQQVHLCQVQGLMQGSMHNVQGLAAVWHCTAYFLPSALSFAGAVEALPSSK